MNYTLISYVIQQSYFYNEVLYSKIDDKGVTLKVVVININARYKCMTLHIELTYFVTQE